MPIPGKISPQHAWHSMKATVLILPLVSLMACTSWVKPPSDLGPFEVTIDPSLQPEVATVLGPGEREFSIGVMMNPRGKQDAIVERQVILKPKSDIERDTFLTTWGATLLSDGSLPPPPQQLTAYKRDIPEKSGYLLVGVDPDPSLVDREAMAIHARRLGLTGPYRVSSERTLALFALLLKETANGQLIGPNLVEIPDICPPESTQEYPQDPSAPNPALPNEGYWNAFDEPLLNDADIRLTEAWGLAEMYGVTEFSVPVAIIDRGFTNTDDYPRFIGRDLIGDDDDPTGTDSGFHGTVVMSILAAQRNNRFGGVGTGAPVALPFAIRTANNAFATAQAIRTATAWGAEVTNASRGAICEWACDVFGWASGKDAEYEAIDEAIAHNVVVVVSAGNEGEDLADVLRIPAEAGWRYHPISVGAINVFSKRALPASNFGWPVDTWAPGTCMPVTPRPGDSDFWDCAGAGVTGTSLAAPYVAGVAAMMKAIVPDMYSGGAQDILQDTANASADPRVATGYINALDALREAALRGGPFHPGPVTPPPDELEPNDFAHRGGLSHAGRYCLNLGPGDEEDGFYFFLDDYRNMELMAEPMFDLGLVTARFGTGVLPFAGELTPGNHHIEVSGEFGMPNLYCLTLTDNGPATIPPDRFEPNNNLPGRAALTYPSSEIAGTYEVTDLNFHVEGDPDCFGLTLPALSPGEVDSLSISVEPDSRGREELFVITVYDDAGTEIDTAYNDITLERVRRLVPSGQIQLCIQDNMRRRNHYEVTFEYRQYPMGVDPTPPARRDHRVPAWMEAMNDMYFAAIPARAAGDEPFDRPYPGDPEVAKAVAEGKIETIPAEMLVLLWDEQKDMRMTFTFDAKEANELDIRLRGEGGQVVAHALVTNVEKDGPYVTITKQVTAHGLPSGVYVFELKGKGLLSYQASIPQQ